MYVVECDVTRCSFVFFDDASGSSKPARNLSVSAALSGSEPWWAAETCRSVEDERSALLPTTGLLVWWMKANALAHALEPPEL